ncbi:tape measure protein, partial [Acinetobacter sichuanensis]
MAQESILRIVIDSRNAERNAQALDRELRSIQRNGDFASRSMDGFSVACRQLAGYMMGVVTAGAAIAKMDDWTNLNNRLRLVTNSQQELNKAMKDTFDIAQRSGAAWGGTAAIYQKIQYNSEKLGLSQEKVAKVTESISKSISNSGSSAQAASAAIYQLSQAFDRNALLGDEFVSINENAGYLMEVFAKGLGVTREELKKMSSAGELTTDKMVQAIEKMSGSIEEDFGKTNFTIGQSITQFSNAATQFIGGAGESSGAAVMLSSSIKTLAENMNLIANVAVLGGVTMLTKAILTQTVSIHAATTSSIARRASMLGELQAVAQATTAEVSRTGAIAQLRAMQLADAQATAARLTGMKRLTYVQTTLLPLERASTSATAAHTAAVNADTLAQNANNAARSRATRIFNAVGGTVGVLTIGVAALAAGYMYMQKRADEANKKLEEQAEVAKKAKEELLALKGLEKDKAVDDMTASFKRQNEALEQSSSTINMQLNAIEKLYKGNKEVIQVVQDARNGTIGMSEAVKRFNEIRIDKEVYNSFKKNAEIFNKNAEEASNTKEKMRLFGIEVELTGRKAQTAKFGIQENTEELTKNKTAAEKAAKAQKDYFDSLNQDVLSANERLAYMNLGFSKEVIDQINKLQEEKQKALGDGVTAIVTTEEINRIIQAQNILDKVKEKEDEITKAKRKQNKENEKQYKYTQDELKMLQKVATLSAKYDLDSIGAKYGVPKNYLAGLMAQESGGNKNAVSPTGAIGYFQTTGDYRKDNKISIADSKNLPVIAEIVAKNLAIAYEKLGSWEAAIRSHNAGVGGSRQFEKTGRVTGSVKRNKEVANFAPSVNKWIVGLGGSSLKSKGTTDSIGELKDFLEFQIEQAKSRKALELEVANEVTKIRENLKDKLLEIDKAGFSPKRTKELKAEYQTRADSEVAIAEYALKTKLDDYSSFQKTEIQLLKDSFNQKKFYASRDIELSRDQRNQAIQLLDQQEKYELAVIQFAREEREFQMRLQFISETQAMEKRYELEEQKLIEVNDLQERNFKREMLRLQKQEEVKNRSDNALQNWGSIQSEIYGTGEMDQLGHTRNERYNTSEELFNSNMSSIDQQEQDPTADLFEIAALREKAWQEHHDRMKLIDQEYWSSSRALQFSMASDMFGTITNMLKESGAERTGIYRGMLVVEKGFAIASAAVQIPDAMAKALNAPFPANIAAMGTVASLGASIVSSIQSVAAGFATGGHVRGPGTSTSDSIPAMLSDYEFVTKASAVKKIGVANMEYMNRTGEMPFQREYEELHKRIAGNQLPEPFIVPKYKDGGLVGS